MLKRLFLLSVILFTRLALYADPKPFPQNNENTLKLSCAIRDLLPTSYAFVDLGLSNEEIDLFEQVKVLNPMQHNRFGHLERLKEEIPQFLRNLGNKDEELINSASEIINKIVLNVTEAFGKQTAWVSVRAFTPTNEYDRPRWHMDGSYYAPYYGVQYKFATALKGRSTLFFPVDEEGRKVYSPEHMNDREFLSQYFDSKLAESPQLGQGAFFIVGNDKFGALHSEPPIDTPRLFISVLPGQHCEIDELYNSWFP